MKLEDYQRKKLSLQVSKRPPRSWCRRCRNPERTCYCEYVHPYHSKIRFVILISKGEARRSIATGRMAHLCLPNSVLIEGHDYTHHPEVQALLADPGHFPLVLYPGRNATCLNGLSQEQRSTFFPTDRVPLVFLIDGTWAQAKRIARLSRNIVQLPQVCFTPKTPSAFRVREQPKEHCYSTIEAIHFLIDFFEGHQTSEHHGLLKVFDAMVEKQLSFETQYKSFKLTRQRDVR